LSNQFIDLPRALSGSFVANPFSVLTRTGSALDNAIPADTHPIAAPAGVKYGRSITPVLATVFQAFFSKLSESKISNLLAKVPSTEKVSVHLTIFFPADSLFPSNSV
jgi:hypothetical protein